MDKSKIEHLNKEEYTHLPHAEQHFEDHEQTDVAIRPLVLTLVAIAAVLVVSYVGLWGTFQLFEWHTARGYSQVSNVEGGVRQVPEEYPALQGVPAPEANPNTPAQDMDEFRQKNDLILAGQRPMRD